MIPVHDLVVWRAFPRSERLREHLRRPKKGLWEKNFVSALSSYGSIPTIQKAGSDQFSRLVTGLEAAQRDCQAPAGAGFAWARRADRKKRVIDQRKTCNALGWNALRRIPHASSKPPGKRHRACEGLINPQAWPTSALARITDSSQTLRQFRRRVRFRTGIYFASCAAKNSRISKTERGAASSSYLSQCPKNCLPLPTFGRSKE